MRLLLLKCQMWCMLLRSTNYFSPFLFRVLLFVDFIYCITKTCRSSETHFHVCRLCRSSWQNGNRANGIIVKKQKQNKKHIYIYTHPKRKRKRATERTQEQTSAKLFIKQANYHIAGEMSVSLTTTTTTTVFKMQPKNFSLSQIANVF